MSATKLDPRIDVLIQTYDQAYDRRAWHGTNLRGSLRGLKLEQLLWRPAPGRHNIWEITLHCAYWKYVVWRKLTNSDKGKFPRKPSDWPRLPEQPNVELWKADLALLEEIHGDLRDAILAFPPEKLSGKPVKSKVPFIDHIYGASSHDLYHAGQIQLVKRLMKG